MDWQLVATVATAFGAGTVITKVIEALTSWREGRHKQRQDGWTAADKAYRQAQMNAEALYETRFFVTVSTERTLRTYLSSPTT